MAWVSRVPFDEDVVIEGPVGVEAVVEQLGPVADELLTFATVDAFVTELAPRSRDERGRGEGRAGGARGGEAQAGGARAGAARAWRLRRAARPLARRRAPPPPGGFDDRFPWGQVLRDSIRKVREERSVPPENRVQRPQVSWHDVGRTARTLYQALRGELPDGAELPGRRGDWRTVELGPDAASVLERARAESPVAIWVGAAVQVRVEPAGEAGRMRVLVDGADVGSVPAPEGQAPATLPAKIDRLVRDGPLVLSVQFSDGSDGAQS